MKAPRQGRPYPRRRPTSKRWRLRGQLRHTRNKAPKDWTLPSSSMSESGISLGLINGMKIEWKWYEPRSFGLNSCCAKRSRFDTRKDDIWIVESRYTVRSSRLNKLNMETICMAVDGNSLPTKWPQIVASLSLTTCLDRVLHHLRNQKTNEDHASSLIEGKSSKSPATGCSSSDLKYVTTETNTFRKFILMTYSPTTCCFTIFHFIYWHSASISVKAMQR